MARGRDPRAAGAAGRPRSGGIRGEPPARRAAGVDAALQALAGLAPDTPIGAYCAVGYRSSALVRALRERGFSAVSNLEGSPFEWANRGLALYRGETAVRRVHPYNWWWARYLRNALHAE